LRHARGMALSGSGAEAGRTRSARKKLLTLVG
jgi:hypothetical protein